MGSSVATDCRRVLGVAGYSAGKPSNSLKSL